MTVREMEALIAHHGLTLALKRQGAGEFVDLECTGPESQLLAFCGALKREHYLCSVQRVNNPDHPDHGKPYALVESFWWHEA
jgi:hypothetical protein